jgi:hypothetical protein
LVICSVAHGQAPRIAERRAVIDQAAKFIGTKETGNNRGLPYSLFMAPYGYPIGTPWCGLFIHHVFTIAGVPHKVKGAALAANWSIPTAVIVNRAGKQIGRSLPIAGDLALFRFQGSSRINHVELIVRWSIDDEDGFFWAIGGNTSNPKNSRQEGVYIKKRSKREAYMVVNRIDL